MRNKEVGDYIQLRLKALQEKKDLQDMIYKGRFSFGISSADYRHLPSWEALVRQKKLFIRTV